MRQNGNIALVATSLCAALFSITMKYIWFDAEAFSDKAGWYFIFKYEGPPIQEQKMMMTVNIGLWSNMQLKSLNGKKDTHVLINGTY